MTAERRQHWAYVAPFAIYILFLAIGGYIPGGPEISYPLRLVATAAALFAFSRGALRWDLKAPALGVLVGLGVFCIWIGPDLLFPGYREHWLFTNSLTGAAQSSLPEGTRLSPLFLTIRVLGSVILVSIIEELFWRAWLMRWLVSPDVYSVPLGKYSPMAFWLTALLFAAEHGPWWDVGLIAGVMYNLWIIRTKSLWSAILAHAVTNAALAAYVIWFGRWEYWL